MTLRARPRGASAAGSALLATALAFFMSPLNSLTGGVGMWNVLGVILGAPGTSVDILLVLLVRIVLSLHINSTSYAQK